MTIQMSIGARNARLDAIETYIGVSARLQLWSGSQPADCATTASGTKIIEITLPSDYLAAASGGTKAKSGTWSGTATGAATAGYWRLTTSTAAQTVAEMQGSVSLTAGGGDMTLDNTNITVGQTVAINTFALTDGNA